MKLVSLALLFASSEAIVLKTQMPTGQETLCAMRRTGKLDIEGTFFSETFKEHRDGGYNAVALAQVDLPKVLDETAFERFLQQNMGNNAGLVYNAQFQDAIRQPWNPMNTW